MRRASALILATLLLVSCAGQRATPMVTPTLSATASPIAITPTPSPPVQRMETPLPAAVEESGAAVAGGKLYVVGGFDAGGNSLNTVWVFDGSTWSSGPRLPLGLDHVSAASLNDQLYVAGGHSFGRASARFFRLDGASWTELAPMRHARGGHALIAASNRLYVIGGDTASTNVAPAEVYDTQARSWADLPALPAPRNHVAGFGFNSSVCVAGGRAPSTARVDCFNPFSSAWIRLPDLPKATSGAGATTLEDGRAVVVGGEDAGESRIIDQFAHLPNLTAWTADGPMLVPRHGIQLAVFEGRAWACGGGTSAGLHPVATCTSVV